MIKVPAKGPSPASIMIVGEAPGSVEERMGAPFVGPAGNVLREVLLSAGINPESVYYTNLCKYRPPGNELAAWIPGGIPNEFVLEGLGELEEEIRAVDPTVIVACGNHPLKWLTGKSGIGDFRGSIIPGTGFAEGRKVIPTWHPSYILRGQTREKPIMRLDLKRAKEQAGFREIRPIERAFYKVEMGEVSQLVREASGEKHWIPSSVSVASVRESLLAGPVLTFDIEWVGRLLCCGFTVDGINVYCFVVNSPGDVDDIRMLLESGLPLCAQNVIFDSGMLEWHLGFNIIKHIKHDTMVGAYVLNIEYPKDLGYLTTLYTEQPQYKDMISWPAIKSGKQNINDVWEYNCIDVWATHQIMLQQVQELKTDPKFQEAFEFDMSKLAPLWEISCRGVKVDLEYLPKLKAEISAELSEYQATLDALNGGPLNVKSNKQVPEFLYDNLEIKPKGKTEGGLRKADDITLAIILADSKLTPLQRYAVQLVRDARERRDLESKSTDVEFDEDGRMRCSYDPTKTVTRRLSSKIFFPTGKGRNWQNESKEKRVRKMYIADEGYEFAYADLKGAEFLVVAELTQDVEMLRLAQMTIDGTGDVHKTTASFLFDKPFEEITSDERYLGKRTRHSSNYMVGWMKLMNYINADASKTGVVIDAARAKQLVARYKAMHPGLEAWWNSISAEVRTTRVLRNCFGFKREFHDAIDAILPEAVAFKPQSTVGDALNFGLLNCSRSPELRDTGFQMLLQIHDAIGFQYPREQRDIVLPLVRKAMDVPIPVQRFRPELHIPVEIAVGPSFGELTVWEEDLKRDRAAA